MARRHVVSPLPLVGIPPEDVAHSRIGAAFAPRPGSGRPTSRAWITVVRRRSSARCLVTSLSRAALGTQPLGRRCPTTGRAACACVTARPRSISFGAGGASKPLGVEGGVRAFRRHVCTGTTSRRREFDGISGLAPIAPPNRRSHAAAPPCGLRGENWGEDDAEPDMAISSLRNERISVRGAAFVGH